METEQQGIQQLLSEHDFNVALTLNFAFSHHANLTKESIRATLRCWDARINRKLLGKNWMKKKDKHIHYFAFIEKLDSTPHLHLIANVPVNEWKFFKKEATIAWQRLNGTDKSDNGVKITVIHDKKGWAGYITKDYQKDCWIESGEFK